MIEIKLRNPDTGLFEESSVGSLTTPRKINGVDFDGTKDITINENEIIVSNTTPVKPENKLWISGIPGQSGTPIPPSSVAWENITNPPSINDITLGGNKTLDQLGIEPKKSITDLYITNNEKNGGLGTGNATLTTVKQVADKVATLTPGTPVTPIIPDSLYVNNLVDPDVTSKGWSDYNSANICTDFQYVVDEEYTRINPSKNQVGTKGLFASLVVPEGYTNLTITISAKKATGVVSDSFWFGLTSINGLTTIASTTVVLTQDIVDYTFTATVLENTEYLLCIAINEMQSTSQASPLIKSVTAYPTTPIDIYADKIIKIPITATSFSSSSKPLYDNTIRCFKADSDASIVINTNADFIILEMYSSIVSAFPSYATISVFLNDVFIENAFCYINNKMTLATISLSPGNKKVELILGAQSHPSGTVIGTYLKSIYAPASCNFSIMQNTSFNKLSFYGDSITVGANSLVPSINGFAQIVKRKNEGNTSILAWGYRNLYDDHLIINTLARSLATGSLNIWLAIGTNDYGLSKQTPSSFGVLYSQLVDAIHSYNPIAKIWCQTPLVRSSESANGLGYTLSQYRTEISNLVSSRTSFCELVNGTEILITSNLIDGVHPSDLGHSIYAGYIIKKLNI